MKNNTELFSQIKRF